MIMFPLLLAYLRVTAALSKSLRGRDDRMNYELEMAKEEGFIAGKGMEPSVGPMNMITAEMNSKCCEKVGKALPMFLKSGGKSCTKGEKGLVNCSLTGYTGAHPFALVNENLILIERTEKIQSHASPVYELSLSTTKTNLTLSNNDTLSITITLKNKGSKKLRFLKYSTPFENPIKTNIFDISPREFQGANFFGIMMEKYLGFAESDVLTVEPGKEIKATMDVFTAVNFRTRGVYKLGIEFDMISFAPTANISQLAGSKNRFWDPVTDSISDGMIQSVVFSKQKLTLNIIDDFEQELRIWDQIANNRMTDPEDLSAPTPYPTASPFMINNMVNGSFIVRKPPRTINCSSSEYYLLQDAAADASQAAMEAAAALENGTRGVEFATWFGATANKTVVIEKLRTVGNLLDSGRTHAVCHSKYCDRFNYAYIFPQDLSHTLFLCDSFWSAPDDIDFASKAGIVIHLVSMFESVYRSVGTEVHALGAADVLNLAKTNPALSVVNADTYQFFVEFTSQYSHISPETKLNILENNGKGAGSGATFIGKYCDASLDCTKDAKDAASFTVKGSSLKGAVGKDLEYFCPCH